MELNNLERDILIKVAQKLGELEKLAGSPLMPGKTFSRLGGWKKKPPKGTSADEEIVAGITGGAKAVAKTGKDFVDETARIGSEMYDALGKATVWSGLHKYIPTLSQVIDPLI